MEKNIKDYLHLYLGCPVYIPSIEEDVEMWEDYMLLSVSLHDCTITHPDFGLSSFQKDEIKPILRPLSDMTKDEALHLAWLCMNSERLLFDDEDDCRVAKDEVDIELVKYDGGNMLDADVEIYIGLTVRCFDGAVVIKRDRSISVVDDNNEQQQPIEEIADKVCWLLSKHFDLFGLIESGLAIDATTLKPQPK